MTHEPDPAAERPPASGEDSVSARADDGTNLVVHQGWWSGLLARHRWLGFVLPFVVFMLAGQLEQFSADDEPPRVANDVQSDPFADDGFAASTTTAAPYSAWYPLAYAIRIGLTLGAMLLVLPVYRQFRFRANLLALVAGSVGAPLWIGLCYVQRELIVLPESVVAWLGGARAAYDPLTELGDRPAVLAGFLAVRLLGLVLVVPIIEEFFLRGFLARMVADADWWKIPIGAVSASSIAAIVAYAALTHPSELLASVAWFLLVTWVVARSKNIWDAVVAHAITNLLLGGWILATGDFWLW